MCIFAYTGINAEAFSILAIFLVFDTLTGVIKTIAVGKKPTSRGFILGIISKLLMLMIPLIIALLAKVTINIDTTGLVGAMIGLLSLGEVYSSIQNIVSIKLQREIEEYDAVTAVLTSLLGWIKNQIARSNPQ